MGKKRRAAARTLLPSLFDQPGKVPPPPPEIVAELIPLLERLLLAAEFQCAKRAPESGRDVRER